MRIRLLISSLALALVGSAGSATAAAPVCDGVCVTAVQAANITADTTWGDDENQVILEVPIFVKDGATLTILPGTIVRGQPRSGPVVPGSTTGSPGALIVTQSGKINAQGNAGNPIIFTTAAVDNHGNVACTDGTPDGVPDDCDDNGFEDAWTDGDMFLDNDPRENPLAPLNTAGDSNVALWGGMVVLGRAPTNLGDLCGIATGSCTVEGLTIPGFPIADATYGGVEVNDSSGIMRYLSVRHAGDEIGEGNELNGITLGAVGNGTIFENIEIYCNFDDGIEWFGGTVNGKNLHVAFAGDDTFDMDQGYTGVNQFMFGIMPFFNEDDGGSFGSGSGDKGGEWDGDDFDEPGSNVNLVGPESIIDGTSPSPWPLSNAINYNVTIIGSTPDGANPATSPASANRGIQMRNGFGGELDCSIVVNTGSAQGYDVDGGGAPGYETGNNICADYDGDGLGDLVRVVSSTFDDGGALPAAANCAGGVGNELDALANGDGLVAGGTDDNVVNSASFPGLVNEDTTFEPKGNAAGKLVSTLKASPTNPRPNLGLVGVAGCAAPSEPGTESSATFRGAFARTAPQIWTTGWTTLNRSGLLAD